MNPLFRCLVDFTMQKWPSLSGGEFTRQMHTVLKFVKKDYEKSDCVAPEWWIAWEQFYSESFDDEDLDELEDIFQAMFEENTVETILPMALHVRNELMIDNAPRPSYRVRSVHAAYFIQWADGMRAEYCCRPYDVDKLDMSVSIMSKLCQSFSDQFSAALIQPGLDTFHDQVATPFDMLKFRELLAGWLEYINAMPAHLREPYMQIYNRVTNHFEANFSHQSVPPKALEIVRRGTTSIQLQWSKGPDSGGFQASSNE